MKGPVLREEMRASEAAEKRDCLLRSLGEEQGKSHLNSSQPELREVACFLCKGDGVSLWPSCFQLRFPS